MDNMTIWKTELAPLPQQEIEVPIGSEFLHAREQRDKVCVWYRCDADAPKYRRTVRIIGTGHDAKEAGRYLGTASLLGGGLILHVFI